MSYVSGKVKKIKNMFGILIPSEMAKELNLREGEVVEAIIKKKKIDGFGIFSGARSFEEEKEPHDDLW